MESVVCGCNTDWFEPKFEIVQHLCAVMVVIKWMMSIEWLKILFHPQLLVFWMMTRIVVMMQAVGVLNLLDQPRMRWRLTCGYPARWMLLSSVMLTAQFVNGLGIQEHGSMAQKIGLDCGLVAVLAHRWVPSRQCQVWEPDVELGDWDGAPTFEEFMGEHKHQVLHKMGFGQEFVDEQGTNSPLARLQMAESFGIHIVKTNRRKQREMIVPDAKAGVDARDAILARKLDVNLTTLTTSKVTMPKVVFHVPETGCKCSWWKENFIFDTGASHTFTNKKSDFVEGTFEVIKEEAGGFVGSAPVEGVGEVAWKVLDDDGIERELRTLCFYVPKGNRRLFSPQSHFQQKNPIVSREERGYFQVKARTYVYQDPDGWKVSHSFRSDENLPLGGIVNGPEANPGTLDDIDVHDRVLDDDNNRMNKGQKELLLWHQKLGHIGFQHLQQLMRSTKKRPNPCIVPKVDAAKDCEPPLCAACQFGQQKRTHDGVHQTGNRPEKEMELQKDDLMPGDCVSLDHFQSTVRGRRFETRGREAHHNRYCGGTIFVDHASGLVRVYPQINLTAAETLKSKRRFEQWAREHGVQVKSYHSDNGVFDSEEFRTEMDTLGQTLTLSGPGAHHMNGAAERGIQTIVSGARTMMVWAAMMWPDESDPSLWPMAMSYKERLLMETPNRETGVSPLELFSGCLIGCEHVRKAHVWGSPVFVLDPTLQDGKKLPKWSPRSRRGQFMGWSKDHAMTCGLVRNLASGYLSAQFHVVHDDKFQSVTDGDGEIDMTVWENLFDNHREWLLDEDQVGPALTEDWLTVEERKVRASKHPSRSVRFQTEDDEPPLPDDPIPDESELGEEDEEFGLVGDDDGNTEPEGAEEQGTAPMEPILRNNGPRRNPRRAVRDIEIPNTRRDHTGKPMVQHNSKKKSIVGKNQLKKRTARSKARSGKEFLPGDRVLFFTEDVPMSELRFNTTRFLQAWTDNNADQDYGFDNVQHPMLWALKVGDKDNPTYDEVIGKPGEELYWDAMDKEIEALEAKECWEVVDEVEARRANKKIIGLTWALKKKVPLGPTKENKGAHLLQGRPTDSQGYGLF